jgi:hypothetical protein
MSLKISHNAGFFSCCSVKLEHICSFINENKKLPTIVDSSAQFEWYKNDNDKDKDITYDYFNHYDNILIDSNFQIYSYRNDDQFKNYSDLDFNIIPIVKKYFTPSNNIKNIINNIEKKYNLSYENICVLFYRGNDKITETDISDYNDYINYCNKIIKHNSYITFLIQSDETEFIELITKHFPNNSFYFKDEIRHINRCINTVDVLMKDKNNEFSKYYLAITVIMAKSKYIICGSGNCSLWIILYRENNNNVCQFLKNTWYNNIDILNSTYPK